MTTRRRLLLGVGAGVLAAPLAALGQQPARTWRIGFLRLNPFTEIDAPSRDAFLQGLKDLGYVEGKSIMIEWRFADGNLKRVHTLAGELVQLKVDVIVAAGSPAASAAKEATSRVPVVMVNVTDPEATGIVASLARPGGNVTGTSNLTGQLGAKNLELLISLVPKLQRVAVLQDPAVPATATILKSIHAAADKVGVTVVPVSAGTVEEVEKAFPAMGRHNARAMIIVAGGVFRMHVRRIAELAIKHRLPSASTNQEFPDAGILLSYSPDFPEIFRRSASYVDRILKGARPGDLPAEQPTKFELVVNMKTAKALGLSIPQPFLMRVDRVIE
jgi:ABC-type uncharacterized transport system substrate-binding protein